MADFQHQRHRMVETQLARRGIHDENLLRAMRCVPRERFVAESLSEQAYEDSPLPIDEHQTISQPFVVATMIEALRILPGAKVLDVGTGSGYAAAILGLMAGRVYAIERHERLVHATKERLEGLGYRNIDIRAGDGTLGWPEAAPFDAIHVAAAGPEVPPALKSQMAVGGRLVMPVGIDVAQWLVKITRTGEDEFEQETLYAVSFVPLIGRQGWSSDE